MMDCVLSLTKCSEGSYIVSNKIAQYLAKEFDIPLIDGPGQVADYETVFFINSMSHFCKFLDEAAEIIRRCKRMIWVQNDYTIYPPTQVRNVLKTTTLEVLRWSTVPQLPEAYSRLAAWVKMPLEAVYVNWNLLTYVPIKDLLYPTEDKLLYYGAFRQDRKSLFDKYFELANYDIAISASSKAMKKFLEIEPMIDDYPPQKNLLEFISQFPLALYLEDSDSNEIYCSPANRFYECLAAGVPQVFDATSRYTFEKAGYNIEEFIVDSQSDVQEALNNWIWIWNKQKEWRMDYRAILDEQVRLAYAKL
jgi:hypothetical protein